MVKAPEVTLVGIPVRLEPAFFVIILLLGLGQPAEFVATWVAIATVSVLVHELGHAVAFRFYGLTPRVMLHGFGGLTSAEGALTPGARIVTSLAGPLAALVLIGLPALYLERSGAVPPGAASTIVSQVVWINVGWSLLNLLPVLPLDGGHVFLAVCDATTKGRGRKAAEVLSVVVAGALAVWALRQGFLFGAVMAGVLAAMNLGQLRKVRQDELVDELAAVHRALLEGRLTEADAVLARVAAARPSTETRDWMLELLGWSRVLRGDVTVAFPDIVSGPATGRGDDLKPGRSMALHAAEALVAGRREEGVALAAWAMAKESAAPPKSLLAAVLAQRGMAGAVGAELGLMGDDGRAGAELLRDLLVHLGHLGAAAEVTATLA